MTCVDAYTRTNIRVDPVERRAALSGRPIQFGIYFHSTCTTATVTHLRLYHLYTLNTFRIFINNLRYVANTIMSKAQTVKQARLQRKIVSNMVQVTIPIAAVQKYTKVDPSPDSTPLHSLLSQPAYVSFSELYHNDVPSLASSSVETLLSSPEPVDWDRETLFDPTSFRDSLYAAPHEDDLPIPGRGFFFNTPSMVEPPVPYLDSSMSLFEQELVSMLTEEPKPLTSHPLLD